MAAVQLPVGLFCWCIAVTPFSAPARADATSSHLPHRDAALQEPNAPTLAALSQQSCNTQCQEQQTDCALRCDQDASCIRRCRAEAEDCTGRCVRLPAAPPAGGPTSIDGLSKPG